MNNYWKIRYNDVTKLIFFSDFFKVIELGPIIILYI